ncbi:hypothetical protein F5884DRAFT_748893 [Xylogone sp. PMI_703]|nr:hypothetical protein F5884DRAFT_748893 [Xylogone sp. PMI_703]
MQFKAATVFAILATFSSVYATPAFSCNQGGDTVTVGEALSACGAVTDGEFHLGVGQSAKAVGTSSDGFAQVFVTGNTGDCSYNRIRDLCEQMATTCGGTVTTNRISKSTGTDSDTGDGFASCPNWSVQIIHT